ncbi:MAG TPA: Fic family protein [Candidatus Angelobacter sp.]|jgi:Fic family protein
MNRGSQGNLRNQSIGSPESFRAFVPVPLPPNPAIDWSGNLIHSLSRADMLLGRLDGIGRVLPDTGLLIYFYSRKEAVLSSQIEGTQSTLSELLLFEADKLFPEKAEDLLEVSNYLAAMSHGLDRLRHGFPLSLRLIREMHEVLLRRGRGGNQTPGEFRRTQNWIGGSRPGNAAYIPPPVPEMIECLGHLEKFIHDGGAAFPPLVEAALVHVQFESIHPFLDGNGRIGRLLIPLLLMERGVLSEPLLYPSLYLKQHKAEYYDLLQRVRFGGEWEEWIQFFVEAIAAAAEQGVDLSKRIHQLFAEDEKRIVGAGTRAQLGPVYRFLQKHPVSLMSGVVRETGLSLPTVSRVLEKLREMGIVDEVSGRERNRVYRYTRYVDMLNEGTEL